MEKGREDKTSDAFEELIKKNTILLDDCRVHPMFQRYRTKSLWTYLCFPCGATCLGEVFLQNHLKGKKHGTQILSRTVWPKSIIDKHPYYIRENKFPQKPSADSPPEIDNSVEEVIIAPGEPVPPGLDEVVQTTTSALEKTLKSSETPIVGLEYLIELIKDNQDFSYFCSLCGVHGDPHTIKKHIDGYRHKMKYMGVNFPTCHNALKKFSGQPKYYPGNIQVLNNICQCIDQAYGRLPPLIMNNDEFEFQSNRNKYMKQISDGKHFTEKDGGNFEELIDEEYIVMVSKTRGTTSTAEDDINDDTHHEFSTKKTSSDNAFQSKSFKGNNDEKFKEDRKQRFIRKKRPSVDSISSLSNVSDRDFDNDCIIVNSPSRGDSHSHSRGYSDRNRRFLNSPNRKITGTFIKFRNRLSPTKHVRSRSRERNFSIRDRNNIKNDIDRNLQDVKNKYKWGQYHERFNKFYDDAKKMFEYNEQFPEKHPCYQEEWKKYWNKKYKEFQGDKKDIWQLDMKPEWIKFWSKKMRDLHEEELTKKREEILTELGLPIDEANKFNSLDTVPDFPRDQNKELSKELSLEKNEKIYKGRSRERRSRDRETSRERERERDKVYRGRMRERENSRERAFQRRSRDKSVERPWLSDKLKERERNNKRSRDRSWDRDRSHKDIDRWQDKDPRSKYEKDPKKLRRVSPPQYDARSNTGRHYSSSRYISEQMSKVERERKDVKWSIYHSKMRIFKDKASKDLEDFEENPKSHPLYHSEWLKFRSKNCDDEHIDLNTEWLKFSRRKLRDMFDKDLNDKKNELLKELGLNRESSAEFDFYERKYNKNSSPEPQIQKDYYRAEESKPVSIDVDNLNVVVVLRHLTALENYLGSLGPKVIDLLAVVLKMEKDKPNSSDDILCNDVYMMLLETVKEKLKGQLIANLIEPHAVQATKTAIQYAASLLHKGSKKMEEEKKKKQEIKSVPVVGVGPVEKAAIANQIAAALIAQGKTDVTTEELEKLINAVVGMANASQMSNEPNISTNSLLMQLMETQNHKVLSADKQVPSSSTSADSNNPMNGLQALQIAYDKNSVKVLAQVDSAFTDKLSDSDLKTLLQNFNDLSYDEQHGLVAYLKKLEVKNPERVQQLRKIINIDQYFEKHLTNVDVKRSPSPFSNRSCGMNPSNDDRRNKNQPKEIAKPFCVKSKDSDDDEDYSYDEVIKCASEKVKEKQFQEELEIIKQSLKDDTTEPTLNNIKTETSKEPEPKSPADSSTDVGKDIFDTVSLASILEMVKNASNLTSNQSTNLPVSNNSPSLVNNAPFSSSNAQTPPVNNNQYSSPNNPSSLVNNTLSFSSLNNAPNARPSFNPIVKPPNQPLPIPNQPNVQQNQSMQHNLREPFPRMPQQLLDDFGRPLLPPSSGLRRFEPCQDPYVPKQLKDPYVPKQANDQYIPKQMNDPIPMNRNLLMQSSFPGPSSQLPSLLDKNLDKQFNMKLKPNYDGQNRMNAYGNQADKPGQYDRLQDYGSRNAQNNLPFQNTTSNAPYSNVAQNQYDPYYNNSGGNKKFMGGGGGEYVPYKAGRGGRGNNQRGSNRGRGNRPYGAGGGGGDSFRRGGSMNY